MTRQAIRHPPGRAGRLWLLGRIAAAQRASELLEVKLAMLQNVHAQFSALAESTAAQWVVACQEAQIWRIRAAALGGQRALRPEGRPQAEVDVTWAAVMGVRYPSHAAVSFPPPTRPPAAVPTAALTEAVCAHERAVEAAVAHAVARAAERIVAAEVATTRVRRRALDERRLPQLAEALRLLEADLDEQERADGVRLRWAARS